MGIKGDGGTKVSEDTAATPKVFVETIKYAFSLSFIHHDLILFSLVFLHRSSFSNLIFSFFFTRQQQVLFQTNELIMQRKWQHERRRKESELPAAKPRFKRSPGSARCSISPSQSTCVTDFQFWAACPHFLLIVLSKWNSEVEER